MTSDTGDIDSRAGHIAVQISWGPNTFDGIINELSIGILGYAVYAVDECGERKGKVLALIAALGIQEGTEHCCNKGMYEATVLSQLPDGVTNQSFMVVPVTSIGALDLGWVTSTIVDTENGNWVPGADQSSVSVSINPSQANLNQSGVSDQSQANLSVTNMSLESFMAVKQDQPKPDTTDSEGFNQLILIPILLIGVPAVLFIMIKCMKIGSSQEPPLPETPNNGSSKEPPLPATPNNGSSNQPPLPPPSESSPSTYQAKVAPTNVPDSEHSMGA